MTGPSRTAALIGGTVILLLAGIGVWRGRLPLRNGIVLRRASDPVSFWTATAVMVVAGICFIALSSTE